MPAVFAVIFFVFEDILLALVTFRVLGRVSHFSLGVKALCTAASCLATIGRCILTQYICERGPYLRIKSHRQHVCHVSDPKICFLDLYEQAVVVRNS